MTGLGSPCGACKFLRRKCVKGCVFAPYFCHEQGAMHFAAIHKVFGASNASKLLAHLPAPDRGEAAVTISYEAQARLHDPIYGCVSHIFALQAQLAYLKAQQATGNTNYNIDSSIDAFKNVPSGEQLTSFTGWNVDVNGGFVSDKGAIQVDVDHLMIDGPSLFSGDSNSNHHRLHRFRSPSLYDYDQLGGASAADGQGDDQFFSYVGGEQDSAASSVWPPHGYLNGMEELRSEAFAYLHRG